LKQTQAANATKNPNTVKSTIELSVYLRLLEISVPVIYGRSADEGPFA
jgi:hypothetical protein